MPLVPALCTQCGSQLEIESSQEAAVCPYCNTPFVVEKAINNYNTTNVTNIEKLHANVVNVSTDNSLDNRLRSGDTYIKFGEYEQAEGVFGKITEEYPYDYRGWWGLIRAKTDDISNIDVSKKVYNFVCECYKKVDLLAPKDKKEQLSSEFEDYSNKTYERIEQLNTSLNKHMDDLNREEEKTIQKIYSQYEENVSKLERDIFKVEKEIKRLCRVRNIIWLIIWLIDIVLIIMGTLVANNILDAILLCIFFSIIFSVCAGILTCISGIIFSFIVKRKNRNNYDLNMQLNGIRNMRQCEIDKNKEKIGQERNEIVSEIERYL